jgi:hypothetical protein
MNQRKNDSGSRNKTLSRGGFVRSLTLGAAGAAILTATGKARADEPSGSLSELALSISALLSSTPDLPGAADISGFIDAAYPTDLSADDALLLQGAIYLKAERIVRGVDALGITDVASFLSTPIDDNPLSPVFFTSILAAAQASAAEDPDYGDRLREAGKLAAFKDETGLPESTAFWILIFILVVIIIALLLTKE